MSLEYFYRLISDRFRSTFFEALNGQMEFKMEKIKSGLVKCDAAAAFLGVTLAFTAFCGIFAAFIQ